MMIIVFLVLVLCVFESFTKGWATFTLAPSMLVVAPVVLIMQQAVLNAIKKNPSRTLRLLGIGQLIFLLLYFVLLPGFGDTKEVLLFGFYTTNINTSLASLSSWIAYASGIATMLISLALLLRLFIYPMYGKKATIIVGAITALVLLGFFRLF